MTDDQLRAACEEVLRLDASIRGARAAQTLYTLFNGPEKLERIRTLAPLLARALLERLP